MFIIQIRVFITKLLVQQAIKTIIEPGFFFSFVTSIYML